MIDKRPVDGDLTDWFMPTGTGDNAAAPMLMDQPPHRTTQVLGPDGQPVLVTQPRRIIGFDLKPKTSN